MAEDVKSVVSHFQIYGEFVSSEPYGSGHINDTYIVSYYQGGNIVRYILQRINHNIFTKPAELMDNVVRVTKHVRGKLIEAEQSEVSRRVLTVLKTYEGNNYYENEDGFWRVYLFIEKARTYDVLESVEQAYEAAKMFGYFQSQLVDLPGERLYDTIPDFHNGQKRYKAFLDALEADACNRAKDTKPEIDWLTDHAWIFDVLPDLVEKGEIPVRITHNDTKINNVMLDDETGEGMCVIDLDTVMPGLSLYDFGDIVRTTTSPADEDEQDLSKVNFELPRFDAILKGFLSTAGEFLNKAERQNLLLGGKLITLIIGTMFLTDHLAGDKYFKIHRENHNLDRCRTQFKLVQSITDQEDEVNKLLGKYI
jgi:hypothetical protein